MFLFIDDISIFFCIQFLNKSKQTKGNAYN